jgi:hypothetical protein
MRVTVYANQENCASSLLVVDNTDVVYKADIPRGSRKPHQLKKLEGNLYLIIIL